jgi:hypothetical protein
MVTSLVLFAVETVPLLVYIFVALVVLAVPLAAIWDKVIQPNLDAKKKASRRSRQPGKAAEPVMEGLAAAEDDAEPAEGVEELAMPADDESAADAEDMAGPGDEGAAAGEAEPEELAFEESLPDDSFSIDTGEKP